MFGSLPPDSKYQHWTVDSSHLCTVLLEMFLMVDGWMKEWMDEVRMHGWMGARRGSMDELNNGRNK